MIHKVKKLNNRGLTLVELLVAVVILSIIVAPLLHSFVTSATTAKKSRQFGDATTAAQNIIETIEATDTDVLLTDADSIGTGATFYIRTVTGGAVSYAASALAVKDSGEKYYIGLPVSSGPSNFEALITLDANHDINDEPVTEYTELVATSQETGADNPDNKAKTNFDEAFATLSGTSPQLSRLIKITVGTGIPDAGGLTVRYPISIVYDYSGGFYYGAGGTDYYDFTYESPTTYINQPVVLADIAAGEPLFSMYYFFDSYYGYGSNTDTVYVYNNANNSGGSSNDLQFNLFLVRQKTADTLARDATYSSRIYQYEPNGLGGTWPNYINACKIYTNMNTNLNTGANISSFEYLVWRTSIWYNPGTSEPKLVVSDKLDRLLYVNVKLFESGSDFSGDPIASMEATKLD